MGRARSTKTNAMTTSNQMLTAHREFGLRLRERRTDLALTQEDFAALCGIDPVTVSLYETGKRSPYITTLLRLADAVGKSTDWLLGREE